MVIDQCLGHKTEMLNKISKLEESIEDQKSSAEFIAKENEELKKGLFQLREQFQSSQNQFQLFEIDQNKQQADIDEMKVHGQTYDLRQRKLNLIFGAFLKRRINTRSKLFIQFLKKAMSSMRYQNLMQTIDLGKKLRIHVALFWSRL